MAVHTSTALADAMAALVRLMVATPGYRSPWDSGPGIPVCHSAEVGLVEDPVPLVLVIGDTGDPSLPAEAGDSDQRTATLGTLRHRQEDGTIRCRAVAQTGDVGPGVVQAQVDAAVGLCDALDAAVRADPSLGLVPGYRELTAMFGGVQSIQPYARGGVVVEVTCSIQVSARI